MSLSISNKNSRKIFFKFLNLLDNTSKEIIIKKLNDPLDEPTEKTF